jgi:hypothetical protein
MGVIPSTAAQTLKTSLITSPRDWMRWRSRGFYAPAPQSVKMSVLRRYGEHCRTWIETGTYRGDTTVWLSTWAERVISIEPQPELYAAAVARTKTLDNVTILQGTSEDLIADVLADITCPTGFWLDGHYSEGFTFKGPLVTPIVMELESIGRWLSRGHPATVLIDDFRMFPNEEDLPSPYPGRRWLLDWALTLDLSWTVENDIFVAWSRSTRTPQTP